MDRKELHEILRLHIMWVKGDPNGVRAYLRGADLSVANLRGANLSEADLRGANLSGANLRGANLREANLSEADLRGADLRGANLSGANLNEDNLRVANLSGANLSGANLRGTNLSWANLSEANLRGANLRGANLYNANLYLAQGLDSVLTNSATLFWALQCPANGAYTAFKKAGGLIVELLIPEDALRTSATSRKCRASKAVVTGISEPDGTPAAVHEVRINENANFWYRIGETVEVNDFFQDRWKECAPGIHHFITREEAVDYND